MKTPRASIGLNRILDLAMRVLPITAIIAIGSFVAAQQTVSPHRRVVKVGVMMALMALMLRFDMVYAVYLFVLLFPFPSGISIGSTNSVLMTVIPMIWAVRATSSKTALIRRTNLDVPIVLFFFAYIISLYNVDGNYALIRSAEIIWRQIAAFAFFYMIVNFVNDETKLFRMVKVMCATCGFVMFTAVFELFFPGAVIIPGWIGLAERVGQGSLTYRIEGIRVGGAFESHGMLADFGTQMIFLMLYLVVKAKNPLEKTI